MKKKWLLLGIGGALAVLVLFMLAHFIFSPGRLRHLRQAYEHDRALNSPISEIVWHMGWDIWYGPSPGKLKVGDPAPNVRFLTPNGKSEIRLLDLLTNKPLVLILGSYT